MPNCHFLHCMPFCYLSSFFSVFSLLPSLQCQHCQHNYKPSEKERTILAFLTHLHSPNNRNTFRLQLHISCLVKQRPQQINTCAPTFINFPTLMINNNVTPTKVLCNSQFVLVCVPYPLPQRIVISNEYDHFFNVSLL